MNQLKLKLLSCALFLCVADINAQTVDRVEKIEIVQEIEPIDTANIYVVVDRSAEPPVGFAKYKFNIDSILTSMYPLEAKANKIEGSVYVDFIVNRDGTLSDFRIVRGLCNGCDETAIEVIKRAGNWTPGKQSGIIVRQRFVYPVKYKIK